jgi:hypothetical protein
VSDALTGDLKFFRPPELLQLLQLAQASGRFDLEREGEQVQLIFERGRLVAGRTNGAAVKLGDVLVHRGVVVAEALDLVLSIQKDQPGERIGQMLVASGAATQEQVTDALREIVRRVVYGVLMWRDGRFRFEPGAERATDDVQLDLDLDRLILEGLRLADQKRTSA